MKQGAKSPGSVWEMCKTHNIYNTQILHVWYIEYIVYSPLFTPKMTLLSVDDPLKTWTCGEWGWRGGAMTILW